MTGEMHKSEVTKENFPLHFSAAKAIGGTVHPFDQYQGPYILTPVGDRLWLLTHDQGMCSWFNQHTRQESARWLYTKARERCKAAREVAKK